MAATAPLPQEQGKPKRVRKTKPGVMNAPASAAPVIDLPPTTQLAVAQPAKLSAIVEPAVSAAQAVEEWKRYQEICRNILEENDYIYYVRSRDTNDKENKPIACRTKKQAEELVKKQLATRQKDVEITPSKKRSAWDKLARFYNLSVPSDDSGLCATAEAVIVGAFVVERLIGESFKIFIYQDAGDLKVVKVSVLLKIVAPNGRTVLGDGACAASERRMGADSFAHADHDIFSTAFTRAFNRGVSRCIGTGEVSAEEFESATPNGDSSPTTIPSAPSADISASQPVSTTAPPSQVERQAPPANQAATASANSNALAQAEAAKPPRAEIPTELLEGPQQSFPSAEGPKVEATQTHAVSPPETGTVASTSSGFKPLAEGASNLERYNSIHDFLFTKHVRPFQEPLVACLVFSVAPLLAGPFEIFKGGKLDMGARGELGGFAKAMRALPDLPARLTTIETVLAEKPKVQFVAWANALVESAKGRGVFGKQ